ncbi:MAG: hypothetical protein R3F20_05620 [Planctomycetota bacterium]
MARFTSIFATLVVAALALGGCVTEEQSHGTGEVRFRDPADSFEILQLFAVTKGDERLGTVERTLYLDGDHADENDRQVWVLRDLNGDMVGYVTDDMRAFRRRAHLAKAELVAALPTVEENVAAILGFFRESVTLVDLSPPRATD